MAADSVALLYALVGGLFMGSYPAPIKCATVLKMRPHPVVIQCYKSFWVFICACAVITVRSLNHSGVLFDFSWWGIVSACAWVPGGLCTISSVPKMGMGPTIVVSTGTSSVMSFLVFWLVLGEKMKQHGPPDAPYYLAPIYLALVIGGMAMLMAAPLLPEWPARGAPAPAKALEAAEAVEYGGCPKAQGRGPGPDAGAWSRGLAMSLTAGALSAVMMGIVQVGKRTAQHAAGCADRFTDCPLALQDKFSVFGSWSGSFGTGAIVVSSIFFALFTVVEGRAGGRPPDLDPGVLGAPCTLAGVWWSLGYFFQTAAALRGGNAVMMPVNYALQLVVSGTWGLLYYREVKGAHRVALWIFAAVWTLVTMVLLSREKLIE